MLTAKTYEFWFVTGSQMLYGEDVLRQVADHSKEMVAGLDAADVFSDRIVFKGVVKNAEEIRQMMLQANADDSCAGVITWMHTFSPSKMWISGMRVLQKPLLHFGTQFNRDIPWDAIDMDFMNLNQSAHGDREHGFITSRMNVKRKVLVGHWEDETTRGKMASWMKVAHALAESKVLKVARFGDNMRNVAVTEGDKVEAQIRLGWTVDGFGVGDLVAYMDAVIDADLDALMDEYASRYALTNKGMAEEEFLASVRYQGRIELGMKAFLEAGGYTAFTTTFEDLHGMKQLPGLAVQRRHVDVGALATQQHAHRARPVARAPREDVGRDLERARVGARQRTPAVPEQHQGFALDPAQAVGQGIEVVPERVGEVERLGERLEQLGLLLVGPAVDVGEPCARVLDGVAHVVWPEGCVPLVDAGIVVPGEQSGQSAHSALPSVPATTRLLRRS